MSRGLLRTTRARLGASRGTSQSNFPQESSGEEGPEPCPISQHLPENFAGEGFLGSVSQSATLDGEAGTSMPGKTEFSPQSLSLLEPPRKFMGISQGGNTSLPQDTPQGVLPRHLTTCVDHHAGRQAKGINRDETLQLDFSTWRSIRVYILLVPCVPM